MGDLRRHFCVRECLGWSARRARWGGLCSLWEATAGGRSAEDTRVGVGEPLVQAVPAVAEPVAGSRIGAGD